VQFPLFLSSATEQVLASGVSNGLGLVDDAQLIQIYTPRDPALVLKLASSTTTLKEDDPKLKLVSQIMAGVHLAATAEAISLGAKVGLDTKKLYEIISTAAGTSWMFVNRAPQMLNGKWSTKKTIDNIIAELVGFLNLWTVGLAAYDHAD
jgi:3-hydroxyisobutyrate dehydrogenase